MTIDTSKRDLWEKMRADSELRRSGGGSTPGGGGPTSDGMEPRVKALEEKYEKMDAKLDTILAEVRASHTDLAYLKGKLEGTPSAQAFGELKGQVGSLPTTAKAATLLGIAVAVIAILNNWSAIKAALLP